MKRFVVPLLVVSIFAMGLMGLSACSNGQQQNKYNEETQELNISDRQIESSNNQNTNTTSEPVATQESNQKMSEPATPSASDLRASLGIAEDYRASFNHGPKPAAYQKYIVMHDTEGESDAESVVNYWDNNGSGVAAHFIVNKDGSIVQCVPLDIITHHAGYGDTGHNALFGITEDGRDDMVGTTPIGSWASDYGMNAWSIGIEMVHVGGSGDYPEAQLQAVDALINYIDAYYGTKSQIIDHKAWRTGNSDTSEEFAQYLANYQNHRTHN